METLMILGVGLVGAAIVLGLLFGLSKKMAAGGAGKAIGQLEEELAHKSKSFEELKEHLGQLVDIKELRTAVAELLRLQEALKTERGRITITQAELETVEGRLRELEEIERELEASGIETKEELKILQKKEQELRSKNEALSAQIANSMAELDKIVTEIEMTVQMQEQVAGMKAELIQTESKIGDLLLQIEQGNEQYFAMKQRYDALDIEYAQLYEKFSETESAKS